MAAAIIIGNSWGQQLSAVIFIQSAESLMLIHKNNLIFSLHKELCANIENSVLQSLEFLCRSTHFEFSKLRSERGYDSYNEQSQQM